MCLSFDFVEELTKISMHLWLLLAINVHLFCFYQNVYRGVVSELNEEFAMGACLFETITVLTVIHSYTKVAFKVRLHDLEG